MVRRKSKEEVSDLEVMTELDIMTENLRNLELTPTTKKSFSAFEPNEYHHLEEGENRSYLDPKSLQSMKPVVPFKVCLASIFQIFSECSKIKQFLAR